MFRARFKTFKKTDSPARKLRRLLKFRFNGQVQLMFDGCSNSSDCGLLAYRELFDAIGLGDLLEEMFADLDAGRKVAHTKVKKLVQGIFSRLAGYSDLNDADRLRLDPVFEQVLGGKAASCTQQQVFETEVLASDEIFARLCALVGGWIERVLDILPVTVETIDLDGTLVPVHGKQKGARYNPRIKSFCFNVLTANNGRGDIEGCSLRPGTAHDLNGWRDVLEPVIARYRVRGIAILFRADAAFGCGEIYDYLDGENVSYALRQKGNAVLHRIFEPLIPRPEKLLGPKQEAFTYASAEYKADDWDEPRTVVAKARWKGNVMFPKKVHYIVTNLDWTAEEVFTFYHGRAMQEQWIKEAKNAVDMTRLSCVEFRSNEVRLQLHALAYNLGNFMRTMAMPEDVSHWTLTTIREKFIKIGGRAVRHAGYITFRVGEVAVGEDLFARILALIDEVRRRAAAVLGEPRRRPATA